MLNQFGPYIEVSEDDRLEYAVYRSTARMVGRVSFGVREFTEDAEGFLISDPVDYLCRRDVRHRIPHPR